MLASSQGISPEFPKNLNIVTLTLTLWPINSGVLTSLLLPHLSSSLTDSLPSLNLLCHSKTDARFMQDAPKALWSIPYVSVALFPSLKHNFITYRSSKVSSRHVEIPQLWQSGFSRVYSNCCCICSFEPEIIRFGQSSHKMYYNKILNFLESTAILNAHTKKSLENYRKHLVYVYGWYPIKPNQTKQSDSHIFTNVLKEIPWELGALSVRVIGLENEIRDPTYKCPWERPEFILSPLNMVK